MIVEADSVGRVNFREHYAAVPVTTTHHLLSFIQNQNGLVEFFNASVDLFDSTLGIDRHKFAFAISAERERG